MIVKSAVIYTEVSLHCGFRWLVSASRAQCTVGRKWLPALDQRKAGNSRTGGVVLAAALLSEICRFANGCRGSCCLHVQCNSKLPAVTMDTAPLRNVCTCTEPRRRRILEFDVFSTCSLHLSVPFTSTPFSDSEFTIHSVI
jgi:hypothetical protein